MHSRHRILVALKSYSTTQYLRVICRTYLIYTLDTSYMNDFVIYFIKYDITKFYIRRRLFHGSIKHILKLHKTLFHSIFSHECINRWNDTWFHCFMSIYESLGLINFNICLINLKFCALKKFFFLHIYL